LQRGQLFFQRGNLKQAILQIIQSLLFCNNFRPQARLQAADFQHLRLTFLEMPAFLKQAGFLGFQFRLKT